MTPFDGKLSDLNNDVNDIILYAKDDRIKALQSLKSLGEPRMRPINKVVALAGFGPGVQPLLIDINVALSICKLRTPVMMHLKDGKTADEIDALTTPGNTGACAFK